MIQSTNRLSYTPMSLTVDDKPFYPVMGEMHFSRYRNRYWEEELCKMKSGGVDIVSLYTIWIHHEEICGEFDFGGDKNLRKFLQTVKRVGLNFELYDGNGEIIAVISQKMLSIHDKYCIDIYKPEHEKAVVAILITLQHMIKDREATASTSASAGSSN